MAAVKFGEGKNPTTVTVTLDEGEAFRGARIVVRVNKYDRIKHAVSWADHVAYVELEGEKDGSLSISCYDAAGNDDEWGNIYPEYFSDTTLEEAGISVADL
jgi:hypothetical protein